LQVTWRKSTGKRKGARKEREKRGRRRGVQVVL
jgi:hypothetical protein